MEYTFGVTVHGEFDDVVAQVTEQLSNQGFGVLSDIDVQATLKAKLDVDRSAYRILGACNPPLRKPGPASRSGDRSLAALQRDRPPG